MRMKERIYPAILLALFLILAGNCRNQEQENSQEQLALALLLSQKDSESNANPDCGFLETVESPAPFSILKEAGTHDICAVCHSGPSPTEGFDITSYDSASARITAGEPENSLLYQKISAGGSMQVYTETKPCLLPAVKKWIEEGGSS